MLSLPGDGPRYGSWAEQAAVWDRAAQKALLAANRHMRMYNYYNGWGLFPQRDR